MRLLAACCIAVVILSPGNAAELIKLTKDNFDDLAPRGKEADAIYGDWILRNDDIVLTLAQPTPGRKANMTVRGVAGMIIDMTRRKQPSDQLSCFYPASGRYLFEDPAGYRCTIDGQPQDLTTATKLVGKVIELEISGKPVADDGTVAVVRYTLTDDDPAVKYSVQIKNEAAQPRQLVIEDSLRCDGNLFTTGTDETLEIAYAVDEFFGQAYAIRADQAMRTTSGNRPILLQPFEGAEATLAVGQTLDWSGSLVCSRGLPGIRAWASGRESSQRPSPMQFKLQCPEGLITHATIEFLLDGQSLGVVRSDDQGIATTELLPGKYTAKISSIGRATSEHEFEIGDSPRAESLSLSSASRVSAAVTDGENRAIPAKIQFIGLNETPSPDFGPDSGTFAVKNLVYTANGKFEQPLAPGTYQVIFSHGTEFDTATREIEIGAGEKLALGSIALPRTVDTTGWVSADFHSHSSPSGDNVSDQLGRVLNLLAEHIEFAPCTEHNRIDTYEDDLATLNATSLMATCTGMELTGLPLPINHQNAFPLHRHEHEQDGGGPQTDADPVAQIERLALWDNASAKVVQSNHPNIPQMLGDRDLDGVADDGFRGMLGWMDVIEVHPPEKIFAFPTPETSREDLARNPIFNWLQLLNLGYRIPGVVNTDSHYNFHGSGWLRNYLECSTDDPSQISIEEMVHASEHGHLIMTTGPFLQAEVRVDVDGQPKRYISGEDVDVGERPLKLWVRVQCPNWFDINRVQVFANGRPVETLNFTRKTHPQLFGDSNVRFESEVLLVIHTDTHLVVATIGEGLKLGPVMGPTSGELPPVAVTNPIFLDYDGAGFKANGDDLGIPFMLPELQQLPEVSKPEE